MVEDPVNSNFRRFWRLGIIGIAAIAGIWAVVAHAPIGQDPAYHRFADLRALWGIPNAWNVVSNLPMLLAGIAGLLGLYIQKDMGILPKLRWIYAFFFAGAMMVAFGSACYHLAPDNGSLVWDRLAMTVCFMSFLSLIGATIPILELSGYIDCL